MQSRRSIRLSLALLVLAAAPAAAQDKPKDAPPPPSVGIPPKGSFPVDAFPDDATPEGVIGMAGDVAELVATHADRSDVPKTGPEKGKQVIVCGGSFASRASECETSYRWVLDGDGTLPSVGFRCVMDDAEYKKRHK